MIFNNNTICIAVRSEGLPREDDVNFARRLLNGINKFDLSTAE